MRPPSVLSLYHSWRGGCQPTNLIEAVGVKLVAWVPVERTRVRLGIWYLILQILVSAGVSLLSKIAAFGHCQLSQVVTANSSDQGSSTKCREVDIKFQMQRSSKLRVESHCLTSQCLDQRSLTLEQYLKMWLRSSTIPGQ